MTKLVVDITMSIDGFIAGTGISTEQPMGKGGILLHDWMFKYKTETDAKILSTLVETTGAVILGNRMYSTAIDIAWEGATPFTSPAIVLCHEEPGKKLPGFIYCTTGIHEALELARRLAGQKNIWIVGGANTIQQFFNAGLVDCLHLHIAPILMNQGTRLFEGIEKGLIHFAKTKVIESTAAVYLKYERV